MLDEKELEKIRKQAEKEFPNDIALQLIYIARRIISNKADLKGLKYLDYIKVIMKEIKSI